MHASRLLLVVLLAAGCARSGRTDATGKPGRVTTRAGAEAGIVVQEMDLNGDGNVDVRTYFREREGAARVKVKKEVDLDFDGRPDVITHFDEQGAILTEQMDSDFDGVLDWTDHYKGGLRVMAEMDTNFDGRPDVFFYYVVGDDGVSRIDRKERDTTGDGRIDTWERFDLQGNVVRTGRDLDGDGKMDVRE